MIGASTRLEIACLGVLLVHFRTRVSVRLPLLIASLGRFLPVDLEPL
jgi:hypothetical protein